MSRPTAAKGGFPYPGHRYCDEWGPKPFTLPPADLRRAPSLMEQRAEQWRAQP